MTQFCHQCGLSNGGGFKLCLSCYSKEVARLLEPRAMTEYNMEEISAMTEQIKPATDEEIVYFDGSMAQEIVSLREKIAALEADNAALRALNAEMLEALKALSQKVESVGSNPSFLSIAAIASIHGAKYDGPTWKSELEAAAAIINKAEKGIA